MLLSNPNENTSDGCLSEREELGWNPSGGETFILSGEPEWLWIEDADAKS